jgi:site-specific DNA recombinase
MFHNQWCPQTTLPWGYNHSPYKRLGDEEIVCDPERFSLIQKGLKWIASKKYSPRQVYEKLYEEGLRTKRGNKISYSVFYRMLTTPFYHGIFEYPFKNGKLYEGKHMKAITRNEYEAIQEALGRKDRERPHKHFFPYSGLMKCGECGCSIVADPKRKVQKNGNVHEYTYYHCTKKRGTCAQKCVEVDKLEKQLMETIERINIPQSFHEWAIEELKKDHEIEVAEQTKSYDNAKRLHDESVRKLDNLVEGWLDKKIPEDVYQRKLPEYEKDKNLSQQRLDNLNNGTDEPLKKGEKVLNLALTALEEFNTGKPEKKKEIIMSLGSNLILNNLKLDMVVEKPLKLLSEHPADFDIIVQTLEPLETQFRKEKLTALVTENIIWGE